MTRRRLVLLLIVAPLMLAGGLLLTLALTDGPGVTPANLARVKVGFTHEQLETILGGPPTMEFPANVGSMAYFNASADGGTWVWFHESGEVMSAGWYGLYPPSTLDSIRAWLGL